MKNCDRLPLRLEIQAPLLCQQECPFTSVVSVAPRIWYHSAMTEKERMLAGELYDASAPQLTQERLRCRRILHQFNQSRPEDEQRRKRLLEELIPGASKSLWIEPPFYCDYGSNIEVGEKVYLNFDCVVLDVCRVIIGNNVLFAPKVQILTATHPVDWKTRAKWLEMGKPVTIGSDVWVGAGALILPGVTIGDRSVIGAGAVVVKDVPSDTVVAGNPARVIRTLAPDD